MGKKSILLPIFFLSLALAACGTPEQTFSPAAGVSAVTRGTISITEMSFQPHTLIVATGATITWRNDDALAHAVTQRGLVRLGPTGCWRGI